MGTARWLRALGGSPAACFACAALLCAPVSQPAAAWRPACEPHGAAHGGGPRPTAFAASPLPLRARRAARACVDVPFILRYVKSTCLNAGSAGDSEAVWRREAWANRYRVDVSFDGSYFSGWQTWENSAAQNRTAHHHVQQALRTVLQAHPLELVSAGRTDAGVHVLSMPCHFDLPPEHTPNEAFLQSAMVRCNRLLPPSLRINQLRRAAPNWHSQFSSQGKTYIYNVHVSQNGPDPFLARTHLFVPGARVDVQAMRAAADVLIGTHDFSAFTNSDRNRAGRLKPVKTMQRLEVHEASSVLLPCAAGTLGVGARAVAPSSARSAAQDSQYVTFCLQADGMIRVDDGVSRLVAVSLVPVHTSH
jgi:tRNA pseudouridine(38-40) synthase